MDPRPEVAYYYPAPHWVSDESGWVKSLLLFFDELAILLPQYMHGHHQVADPSMVMPLEERGLLRVLEPNDWIDEETAESLAEIVNGLLTSGAFDGLPENVGFHELSYSRMGHGIDVELAETLVENLAAEGLALPSEDGVSIPLHPTVRTAILVILGQLSRASGERKGHNVHPATNNLHAVEELLQTLSREPMPSAAKVITLDLEPVSFDLGPVPLEEVLDFREEHRLSHRAHVRDLRRFMVELADIDEPGVRERVLVERRQEIADAAHGLQRSTRPSLGKNLASFGFGIAGAAWGLAAGDPLGFAFTAGGITAALVPGKPAPAAAYSYVFSVNRQFGGHLT